MPDSEDLQSYEGMDIEGASYDKAIIDEPKYMDGCKVEDIIAGTCGHAEQADRKYKGGQIEGPKDKGLDNIPVILSASAQYGPVPCEASQNIIMEMVNSPLTPFGQYHKRQMSDAEIDEYIAQANAQTDAADTTTIDRPKQF